MATPPARGPILRSRHAALPVYRAIQEHLRALIAGPDYGPGDRVPSERALAEQLGANRMTVRKAIDGLVAQGVLERNGTSGTLVAAPRVRRPVDANTSTGIARIVQSAGGTPGNRLLHFEEAPASASVAGRLRIAEGEAVMLFRRLWTVDAQPFCIETSHLPARLVPGLAAEDLVAGQSLYALLRARYGLGPLTGEREIGVASCGEMEARLLELEPGASCLLLRLVSSDADGRPVEYTRSVNHPGRVVFRSWKAELN
ncbi:GntR family transcriptional regulator [Roseomonas elaeocarpi]|uniref:GntR family transcriptional regulator n=1 Tax=Roseomonas elaeocarpi TaxID=907779 RepID=A0ABV6JT84_9PROT